MTSELPPEKSGDKKGFFDRLAQRSTGLQNDVTPVSKENNGSDDSSASLWRLGGIGLQLAVTVAVAALVGRWIDHAEGWGYAATLTLTLIVLVGNLYLLVREVMKLQQ